MSGFVGRVSSPVLTQTAEGGLVSRAASRFILVPGLQPGNARDSRLPPRVAVYGGMSLRSVRSEAGASERVESRVFPDRRLAPCRSC
jgi:hypothetical protein